MEGISRLQNTARYIKMKERGIEDGDIIKIEDFEFEYYDEDYFED